MESGSAIQADVHRYRQGPPERLRRRVMASEAKCDVVANRQRAVFAENLCGQLEGHLLQLIAENDRLEVKLKQSRTILRQFRQSIRGSKAEP